MKLNFFKIKTNGIHHSLYLSSFLKKKKEFYFTNFPLLKKTKGFFGLKKNNPIIIRNRKRSSVPVIANNSKLLKFNNVPFILTSYFFCNIRFSIFYAFKSATNVLFFLKFKLLSFSLFSYVLNQEYCFFDKSFFSILGMLILWTAINDPIVSLRNWNNPNPQYSLSFKSISYIIGINSKLNYFIIQLPSLLKKVFYFTSFCLLLNTDALNSHFDTRNNRSFFKLKAGSSVNKGFRPTVRGVAMNPVDHPHGGRTKTVKLPRTPWGLVTKKK